MDLDNISRKVLLATGTSRGIGQATATALGKAGVDLAVNYLTQESAAQETCERVQASGRRATAVRADVSQAVEGAP
jgi:NAD(P)-dependent dehydrogenase (short-subunit alcohol dehydrogenase family)